MDYATIGALPIGLVYSRIQTQGYIELCLNKLCENASMKLVQP